MACLLKVGEDGGFANCNESPRCRNCGFDEREHERRQQLLAENGLTTCEDGLMRLIIPEKEDNVSAVLDALESVGISREAIMDCMVNRL